VVSSQSTCQVSGVCASTEAISTGSGFARRRVRQSEGRKILAAKALPWRHEGLRSFFLVASSHFLTINVKEASWKTHETLTAWGHANGLL
jgi:hypothetical protein